MTRYSIFKMGVHRKLFTENIDGQHSRLSGNTTKQIVEKHQCSGLEEDQEAEQHSDK